MKKSEIKINGEYAYKSHEWGSAQRVRVIGECPITQGYGYRRKTITGSRIQVLDSRTGAPLNSPASVSQGDPKPWILNVANRTLREDWAPYWEREVAAAKARKEGADRLADDRAARSRVLLDLIPLMRDAGFEDTETTVRDSKVRTALDLHVEDCLEVRPDRYGREGETETVFKAPAAAACVEYVSNGSSIPVKATDLVRLLVHGNVR